MLQIEFFITNRWNQNKLLLCKCGELEKARWELHEDAKCCFKQILKATFC